MRAARALVAPVLVHKAVAAGVAGAVVLVAGGAIALFAYRSGNSGSDASSVHESPLRELPVSSTYGQIVDHPVLLEYQMIDSKVGWAQANDGYKILLTEDGGQTWRNVSPALAGGATPIRRSVAFLDDGHAWVLGSERIGAISDLQARVYWTADQGKTWHESDSLVTKEQLATQPSVTFLDPAHGWILSGTFLYRTTDGGRTWQTVPLKVGTIEGDPPGSLPQVCVPNLRFVSASRGFAYGGATVAPSRPSRASSGLTMAVRPGSEWSFPVPWRANTPLRASASQRRLTDSFRSAVPTASAFHFTPPTTAG